MRSTLLVVLMLVPASAVSAATLDVEDGILLGAFDVLVNGFSYDVEFAEGTCASLYSGCDESSDFVFDENTARDAAQALLDQVFSGYFDHNPEDIFGCTGGTQNYCYAITPYARDGDLARNWLAQNFRLTGDNRIFNGALDAETFDSSGDPGRVFAVWTPVPEPSTALLIVSGLAALAVRKRVSAKRS